jgi:hypothetical protein
MVSVVKPGHSNYNTILGYVSGQLKRRPRGHRWKPASGMRLGLTFAVAPLILVLCCCQVLAQQPPTTCGNTKLACLLPTAFHTNPPTFNFFNEAFATQVGQLPLANPASSFILVLQNGVPTQSQDTFGPLVAERFETIGHHTAYLAFTFQRFVFHELDGNNLGNIPILFSFPTNQNPTVVTYTQNKISTNVSQYVAYGTYGLTSHFDLSVAIPFLRVSMGVTSQGTEYSTTSPTQASFKQTIPGSASGIGDVVFAGKGTLWKKDNYGIALGGELRIPSGDEQNFLGSGATGVKPYVVFARGGKFAPHVNLAYQWNSNSSLAINANNKESQLPGYFGYTFGADIGATKRLTLAADFVGQHYFDAALVTSPQQVTTTVNNQQVSFSSISPAHGSYEFNYLAFGLKANLWKYMVIQANIDVKVSDGGLRATVVPFVGVSYTF